MASKFRQEMPPPGGFADIDYKQKVIKAKFRGFHWSLLGVGAAAAGIYLLVKSFEVSKWLRREVTDARVAVEPFIHAEYEREILKQMRRNRDEENELMKNVEGWQTGTYFGKPLYNDGKWHPPHYLEFYCHNDLDRITKHHKEFQTDYYVQSIAEK